MACRIERERALDDYIPRDRIQQIAAARFIGARVRGQDDRLPAVRRKVLYESQRSLDSAGARKRRELERNEEDALHADCARAPLQMLEVTRLDRLLED